MSADESGAVTPERLAEILAPLQKIAGWYDRTGGFLSTTIHAYEAIDLLRHITSQSREIEELNGRIDDMAKHAVERSNKHSETALNWAQTLIAQKADLAAARSEIVALRETLKELVDIVEEVPHSNGIDSFTLQPAKDVLSRASASYAHLRVIPKATVDAAREALSDWTSAYAGWANKQPGAELLHAVRLSNAYDNGTKALAQLDAAGKENAP